MKPATVFSACVDVSTSNGFGAMLRLLERRNDIHRLPPPVLITLTGMDGITVQFGTEDRDGVDAWAAAFNLPAARHTEMPPAGVHVSPLFGVYASYGVCFRLGINAWCLSGRGDRARVCGPIRSGSGSTHYITTDDMDERAWA